MPVDRLDHCRRGPVPECALAQPRDDHADVDAAHGVAELGEARHEPDEADRVCAADGEDDVGLLERHERGGVAARRLGVEDELLVRLERRPDVDHHEVDQLASDGEHLRQRRGAHLVPSPCARDPGQHKETRAHLTHHAGEGVDVERAGERAPARRGETGAVVDQAQHHRDRRRPGVGVDEQHRRAEPRGLVGQRHRDRRTARGAGRPPHRHHPPAPGDKPDRGLVGRRCRGLGVERPQGGAELAHGGAEISRPRPRRRRARPSA